MEFGAVRRNGTTALREAVARSRPPRSWLKVVAGVGFGSGALAVAGAVVWLDFSIQAEDRASSEHLEEWRQHAEESQRQRAKEIERLTSEASWGRLAGLLLKMLPVAFCWPLWFVDEKSFWSFVADRIDSCGPAFVKLAQWLSTRRDMFPESVCEALSSLQNNVKAPWSQPLTSSEVETSLREGGVALRYLEPEAHAGGSIAEVFFGVMEDGTEVAVKCLRPGVQDLLNADLGWLLRFGAWTDNVEALRMLGMRKAAEEFCEHVQMQTDLSVEASHLHRFRANFADSAERVRFPEPLAVTPGALVLSREQGQELTQLFRLPLEPAASDSAPVALSDAAPTTAAEGASAAGLRAEKLRESLGITQDVSRSIAQESMAAYMRMIFNDRFIHGDLHPGNIMLNVRKELPAATGGGEAEGCASAAPAAVSEREVHPGLLARLKEKLPACLGGSSAGGSRVWQLVVLDAGLAIPLAPEKVEVLRSLAISIIYSDFGRAAEILYQESPDSSGCEDPAGFKRDLARTFAKCRKNVWDEGYVQVGDTCTEALSLVQQYRVGLDTTLTWMLFGMLSIEGSARQLDPEVDCAKAATKYIITVPSLLREMKVLSWNTSKHMLAEIALGAVGMDYWDLRYRFGLTWQDLQS